MAATTVVGEKIDVPALRAQEGEITTGGFRARE